MIIAHRGLWNHQNKVSGIVKISSFVDAIEVDVRKNSHGILVLCHDRDDVDKNNDTFEELCKVSQKLHIILDIKGNLALEVLQAIQRSVHDWELCSYDYRCVKDLCRMSGYKVGLITTGMPPIEALRGLDFISQDYEFLDDDMLKTYRELNLVVYVFNTNKKLTGVNHIKNILMDIV